MASWLSYLPQEDGLLPKWLFFISIVSLGNSIQSYISLAGTRQVYSGSASLVTGLSARTFGTWTALSSLVRLSASYHIGTPAIYELCLWTFIIAFVHFMLEWLVFGTAKLGRGLAGPMFVSTFTMAWMYLQWDYYIW